MAPPGSAGEPLTPDAVAMTVAGSRDERPDHVILDGVEKHYGSAAVVSSLDLKVKHGEFIALLGPSGCGKTTTLRMLAGLIPVSAGRIMVGGVDVTRLPAYRRDVGIVFQNYALFPHMSVEQNIAFGLEMRRVPRAETARRVAEALALVRLEAFSSRRPRELSGGQQQRVALARALVIRPSILLLDEPLSNLDARLRDDMRSEIHDIQRRLGITTVFVTHDQVEALSMCDRVAVMQAGALVQCGTPTEVYERPRNPFVAEFVGRANKLTGSVRDAGVVASGTHTIRATGTPKPGTAVLVMVRPHRIAIHGRRGAAAAGDNNLVPGRVMRRIYLGDLVQYDIEVGSGVIQVEKPTVAGLRQFDDGDDIELEWSVADTLVFEDGR
jgi:putative spermidine/putrescine transport system ATP-binding protein